MTVAELLDVPDLSVSLVAGRGGLRRQLSWAHVCEMPDPTGWLNGGELVLSTGMALGSKPKEQCDYLRRLHAVDAAAFLCGETPWAKELSPELRELADELAFPVLWAAHEVPYISIVRLVAARSEREQHRRLQRLQKAYEHVRTAAFFSHPASKLLEELGGLAHCELSVRELPYSNLLFGAEHSDPTLPGRLVEATRDLEKLPAVLRLTVETGTAIAVPTNASQPAVLLAYARHEHPDTVFLQHVATILASELERLYGERERDRRTGAELFSKLESQTIDGSAAEDLLAERGLGDEPRAVAVWEPVPQQEAILHHRLAAKDIPCLLYRRDVVQCALVAANAATKAALAAELSAGGAIGMSGPLGRVSRVPDAVREARIALNMARQERRTVARYGDRLDGSAFVPRTLSEAETVVESMLGVLQRYDADNSTDLLPTLRCFMHNNRKWQKTAEDLHVHKQTVHYRIRRVEALTERRLSDVRDIAALWFALEAESMLRD